MGLKERLRAARAKRPEGVEEPREDPGSDPQAAEAAEPSEAKGSDPTARKAAGSGGPEPGQDWLSKFIRALVGGAVELLKLAREMLVIPAQLWLFVAEIAGAAVLRVWRLLLAPVLRAAWWLIRTLFALAQRHVTPARAVAAVAIAAAVGLAASQWLDYRSVTVGNDAYSGGVEAVAPAPDIARDRAGEAHAWVMVPLAVAAIACVLVAMLGRARGLSHDPRVRLASAGAGEARTQPVTRGTATRAGEDAASRAPAPPDARGGSATAPWAARLLLPLGLAAIAIAIIVDAPKGLDEGSAADFYQGAKATLLEGFWVQIAAGGVLAVCGLILPMYLRPAPVGDAVESRPARRSLLARAKGVVRMPSRPKAPAPEPSGPKGSSA